MSSESIEQQLAELSHRLDSLPEADEPPPTTLQILGRSRREAYWQRLLAHFLSPDKAHGIGNDLLEQILTGFDTRTRLDFSYSRLDLENVQVEQEVGTSRGRPDLVIWSPDDWFVCIEMKIDSPEGNDQTSRYVEVGAFDEIDLNKDNVPVEQHHYVYLAPENAPSPDAEEFVTVSWEWLASELQAIFADRYGEYPSRTTAQLSDFTDTIQNELTMTEYQENKQEKIALAIEHYEPMTEVLETLEEYAEDLNESWPDWFIDQNPPSWNDDWHARLTGNSYRSVHRSEWAINYPGDDGNNKHSDLHIYWVFRITKRHLGRNEVKNQIVVTGQNENLKQSFRENFYSEGAQEKVSKVLTNITSDSNKEARVEEWDGLTYQNIIKSWYQFDFERGDGFKDTVIEVFEDLQPIFDVVTDSVPERQESQ